MREYKHPEALVSTGWVAQHTAHPRVRLVKDVRLMNDGRKKWELEGRPFTTLGPQLPATN